MSPELIKLFAPLVFFAVWLDFMARMGSKQLLLPTLFFASLVGCSQNFSFYYREIHQAIQLLLVIGFVYGVLVKQKFPSAMVPMIVFGVLILVSLLDNSFDEDARVQVINFLMVSCVVGSLFRSLERDEGVQCLMGFIVRLALVSAVIGLLEFLVISGARIEGASSNSNYYALVVGIGFSVAFSVYSGRTRFVVLAIMMAAIVASGSRSAMIFPLLSIVWGSMVGSGGRRKILIAMVGAVAFAVLLSSGITRFSETEATEASDAERLIFARVAYSMANEHPMSGVGWGRFVAEFSSYASAAERVFISAGVVDVSRDERRVTHNDLLRILAELGWGAAVLALLHMAMGARKVVFLRERMPGYILPVWVGILFFSLTHNNMNNGLFWYFYLLPFDMARKLVAAGGNVVARDAVRG
ncbi:MAG: O-antigen ligase family protein [Pseudomonadota bacterium]